MKNYYIYLNKDNSVFDITEENKHNKDFVILDYEKTINLLHLMKAKKEEEKVFYIENDFEIKKDFDILLNKLRDLRNKKLKETDFYFLTDVNEIYNQDLLNDLKIKRKILRDITLNLNTIEDIENAIKNI